MTHKKLMPNTWQVSLDNLLKVVREVCTVYSYKVLMVVASGLSGGGAQVYSARDNRASQK